MQYVLAYDIGTTGVKSCLFKVDDTITLMGGEYATYGLYILENGGAEQDAEEWWSSLRETTGKLLAKTGIAPGDISGIAFCSQMQGMVLVDREGNALRRPMSYMDQRASKEMKKTENYGLAVSGVNVGILLKSLVITSAASTSVKDPLWKYKWVEANEPDIFEKVYKWLDVKEYLICRMTGEFIMTRDSAFSTFLYDSRPGKEEWSKELCRTYGVHMEHLPRLIECTDVAGTLTEKAAEELGLVPGIKVYGSGGDATLIGIGAGSSDLGDTHIYWGTSGWVGTVIDKQVVDLEAMIAGIVGAEKNKFNYFAEMETAGKSFDWVKNHLALDEINIYQQKLDVSQGEEATFTSLYDYLSEIIGKVPAGANGVLFTPWLHGNRCPFEDPNAGGIFFNIRLETGKSEMLRAVVEGICYHLRWMLECEDKRIKTSKTIRFVGGGSLSKVTCQILSDITGRTIETVENPKDIGSVGAAMLVAVGSGTYASLSQAKKMIQVTHTYTPNEKNREVYHRNYQVFKQLYRSNRKNFELMNR